MIKKNVTNHPTSFGNDCSVTKLLKDVNSHVHRKKRDMGFGTLGESKCSTVITLLRLCLLETQKFTN